MNLKPYSDLNTAERAQALEDARREGREAAHADLGQGGYTEELAYDKVFLACVIEPAWHADLIDDDELAEWKADCDDPRAHAWIASYNEYKAEKAAELARA